MKSYSCFRFFPRGTLPLPFVGLRTESSAARGKLRGWNSRLRSRSVSSVKRAALLPRVRSCACDTANCSKGDMTRTGPIPKLTEEIIQSLCHLSSFISGRKLYLCGAVSSLLLFPDRSLLVAFVSTLPTAHYTATEKVRISFAEGTHLIRGSSSQDGRSPCFFIQEKSWAFRVPAARSDRPSPAASTVLLRCSRAPTTYVSSLCTRSSCASCSCPLSFFSPSPCMCTRTGRRICTLCVCVYGSVYLSCTSVCPK